MRRSAGTCVFFFIRVFHSPHQLLEKKQFQQQAAEPRKLEKK
jgi:hypothetical protein